MIYPVPQVSLLQCLGTIYEQVNGKRKMVLNLDKDGSVADTQNQTGAEADTIDDNARCAVPNLKLLVLSLFTLTFH